MQDKPFVAWDGEAVKNRDNPDDPDHPYSLFGSSLGWRIRGYNLTTMDCLELMIESEKLEPDAIHFGFAFGYDVNMIVRNLKLHQLYMLKTYGRTRFEGFDLEYIPRKWFRVSYGKKGHRNTIRLFDVFSFFNASLGKTLRKYSIGSEEQLQRIDTGKGERPDFSYGDIVGFIEPYWETELVLMVSLMDKFRGILEAAGIYLSSWHGPGAIASYLLRNHDVKYLMDYSNDEVVEAARYAYFGGRFEPFVAGYYEGDIFSADINSAYPFAHSRLPNLSNGKWRHELGRPSVSPHNTRLGLYHIRYGEEYSDKAMPLPHREKSGAVCFAPATEGWFHAPEAAIVCNNPHAEFVESWIFEDDGSYPFAWIEEMYESRRRLKEMGNPAELGFKLGLNSLYGQVAQRAGWERTGGPPKWHQLEWAGAITSECRRMVYAAAKGCGQGLISIDTDGILSAIPIKRLPNGEGENLGQWKLDVYTGMFYLQNGIYWLRDREGNWLPPKSRGIPRRKLEIEPVLDILRSGRELEVTQHMFLGFGLALRGRMHQWRQWLDEPRVITFGGSGKRIHVESHCNSCKRGVGKTEGLHRLIPIPPKELESYPHYLPWNDNKEQGTARMSIMDLEKWGIF